MQTGSPLESVLKRDRAVVLASIAAIVVLAWAYMVHLAQSMNGIAFIITLYGAGRPFEVGKWLRPTTRRMTHAHYR